MAARTASYATPSDAPVALPPIFHAVGGSLGSALALLLFFPLERARIEMQSAAAAQQPEKHSDDIESSSDDESNNKLDCVQQKDDSWVQFAEQKDRKRSEAADEDEASWSMSSHSQSIEDRSAAANRSELISCLVGLKNQGELYRGVSPVITTMAASNFVFFYAHAVAKRYLFPVASSIGKKTPSLSRSLFASCLAGIANVLITNPLWVANLRFVQGESKTPSLFQEVHSILRVEGKSRLWNGTWASLLLVSNPVIQFFLYEQLKANRISRSLQGRITPRQNQQATVLGLTPVEAFLLGATAKAAATVATYPLQLAQVLLRIQQKHKEQDAESKDRTLMVYNGTWDCFRKLFKQGGVAGLFRGLEAKLLQTVLTAAFTFLTYEQIIVLLRVAYVKLYQRRLQSRRILNSN